MEFFQPETDLELADCFDAFKVLRPHLAEENFIAQVKRQREQGYRIVAIKNKDDGNSKVPSAAGYRFAEFLAWGKVLYIDDLTTLPEARGAGHADQLMDWLINKAKEEGCQGVHLDTGYQRHNAHRLYHRKGLHTASHHMILEFD